MSESSSLRQLVDLLQGSGARAVVVPERQGASTIYDLQYRLGINACAFALHATGAGQARRIQQPKLKLLQFIAMRPWLLPVMREWSERRKGAQQSLLGSHLRRGFLSDVVHDNVIAYMSATLLITLTDGGAITLGPRGAVLIETCDQISKSGYFLAERSALVELKDVTITKPMLEGW